MNLFFMNSKIYHLMEDFHFYYGRKQEKLFLKGKFSVINFYLPSWFFVKMSDNLLSFLFTKKTFFKSFLYNFRNIYNSLKKNFQIKLKLKGLGYRIVAISKKLYSFFFNYSNFIYLHVPRLLYVCSYKKRLLLLSPMEQLVKKVFSQVMNLKRMGPYFRRGWVYKRHFFILQKKTKLFI